MALCYATNRQVVTDEKGDGSKFHVPCTFVHLYKTKSNFIVHFSAGYKYILHYFCFQCTDEHTMQCRQQSLHAVRY